MYSHLRIKEHVSQLYGESNSPTIVLIFFLMLTKEGSNLKITFS